MVGEHDEGVGGVELPEVLPHPSGLLAAVAGEPFDGSLGQAATVVGLVEAGQAEAEQVGDLGGVGVEVAGGEQARRCGGGVVAEGGEHGVHEGALAVGPVAPEDRQHVLDQAADEGVAEQAGQVLAHARDRAAPVRGTG